MFKRIILLFLLCALNFLIYSEDILPKDLKSELIILEYFPFEYRGNIFILDSFKEHSDKDNLFIYLKNNISQNIISKKYLNANSKLVKITSENCKINDKKEIDIVITFKTTKMVDAGFDVILNISEALKIIFKQEIYVNTIQEDPGFFKKNIFIVINNPKNIYKGNSIKEGFDQANNNYYLFYDLNKEPIKIGYGNN